MLSSQVWAQHQAKANCLAALRSGKCKCGHAKQTGMAFCFKCWNKLPQNMRRALYSRIGKGFEAAYAAACQWLDAI